MKELNETKELKAFDREMHNIASRYKKTQNKSILITLKIMSEFKSSVLDQINSDVIETYDHIKTITTQRDTYLSQLGCAVHTLNLMGIDSSILTFPVEHVRFIINNRSKLTKNDTDSLHKVCELLTDYIFLNKRYPKDFQELKESAKV